MYFVVTHNDYVYTFLKKSSFSILSSPKSLATDSTWRMTIVGLHLSSGYDGIRPRYRGEAHREVARVHGCCRFDLAPSSLLVYTRKCTTLGDVPFDILPYR